MHENSSEVDVHFHAWKHFNHHHITFNQSTHYIKNSPAMTSHNIIGLNQQFDMFLHDFENIYSELLTQRNAAHNLMSRNEILETELNETTILWDSERHRNNRLQNDVLMKLNELKESFFDVHKFVISDVKQIQEENQASWVMNQCIGITICVWIVMCRRWSSYAVSVKMSSITPCNYRTDSNTTVALQLTRERSKFDENGVAVSKTWKSEFEERIVQHILPRQSIWKRITTQRRRRGNKQIKSQISSRILRTSKYYLHSHNNNIHKCVRLYTNLQVII